MGSSGHRVIWSFKFKCLLVSGGSGLRNSFLFTLKLPYPPPPLILWNHGFREKFPLDL